MTHLTLNLTSTRALALCAFPLALALSGCGTLKRAAMNQVADSLTAGDAGGVFASDDDPELIRDALPFGLKLYESLLASNPGHRGLQVATASGFIQYAHAFVMDDAERAEQDDYAASKRLKARALKLYLRGRDTALRGLDHAYPGWTGRLRASPGPALDEVNAGDVPLLFWAGAGWGAAITADPGNMSRVAELSLVEAVMRRALALDPDFEQGGLHEFFISFEGGRSKVMGGSDERAEAHFEKAIALQEGKKASPYVALASTVAVRNQDLARFRALLQEALAVDPDAVPAWRLANVISQRKAQALLDEIPELFLVEEENP